MEPTRRATVAILSGSGDYGFLKNFQLLHKFNDVASEHFSIWSEKTEHGLTVKYAKYEYIENVRVIVSSSVYGEDKYYPTHFIFIEFATLDDAMKAMWDGFSLEFTSFICTFLSAGDVAEAYDQMHKRVAKTRKCLMADKDIWHKYLVVIVRKDLEMFRDGKAMEQFAREFPCRSIYPRNRHSIVIQPPGFEKWGQIDSDDDTRWHYEMTDSRTEIPSLPLDESFKGPSHWNFSEKTGKPGAEVCAEIFLLPESEGGALIAHGDRRTVSDGPNNIEVTFNFYHPARSPLSPGDAVGMILHFDQDLEYLDVDRRFTVKQDGRLVALGILQRFGR